MQKNYFQLYNCELKESKLIRTNVVCHFEIQNRKYKNFIVLHFIIQKKYFATNDCFFKQIVFDDEIVNEKWYFEISIINKEKIRFFIRKEIRPQSQIIWKNTFWIHIYYNILFMRGFCVWDQFFETVQNTERILWKKTPA